MRLAFLAVALSFCAFAGCGDNGASGSAPEDDASVAEAAAPTPVPDGGSPACANAGGQCVPFSSNCPILQQNFVLCADSLLICCLPPGGETLPQPDSGGGPETGSGSGGAPDSGGGQPDSGGGGHPDSGGGGHDSGGGGGPDSSTGPDSSGGTPDAGGGGTPDSGGGADGAGE